MHPCTFGAAAATPRSSPALAPPTCLPLLPLPPCSEEQEKFNVWVAWLNMENLYGSEEVRMGWGVWG